MNFFRGSFTASLALTSFLRTLPMPAFCIGTLSLNIPIRASRLPRLSALRIMPSIDFSNSMSSTTVWSSFLTSSNLLSSETKATGLPAITPSRLGAAIFTPAAAETELILSNCFSTLISFKGLGFISAFIFVTIGSLPPIISQSPFLI